MCPAPCMMFDPRLPPTPSTIFKQAPSAIVFPQQAHTHTHTHRHTGTHAHTHTHTDTHTHACTQAGTHAHTQARTHARTQVDKLRKLVKDPRPCALLLA